MDTLIDFLPVPVALGCLYLVSKMLGALYRAVFVRRHRPAVRNENIRTAVPPNPQRPAPSRPHGARPSGWIGFKHQGMEFEFQIVRVGQEVRSYILAHPDYGGRDTGPHETHRLYDSERQRHYVCTGWPPETFEEVKEWTRVWCRYTEHYIRTGQPVTD